MLLLPFLPAPFTSLTSRVIFVAVAPPSTFFVLMGDFRLLHLVQTLYIEVGVVKGKLSMDR